MLASLPLFRKQRLVLLGRLFCTATTESSSKWPGVVVGKIHSVTSHPSADRLSLCQVQIESPMPQSDAENTNPNLVQIVCGAPNVRPGLYVPVATVGTRLSTIPGTEKPVKIKKSKLRGEVSFGMICSEFELGLTSVPSEGIMELQDSSNNNNTIIGKDFDKDMML